MSNDINAIKYVVISTARNEKEFIEKTIRSMLSQTIKPSEWVIVNDGSTDRTGEIVKKYASQHPWIKMVERPNRGFSKLGSGVVEAFYDGISYIGPKQVDFIVKLDTDISFDERYFENAIREFLRDPQLGIASGQTYLLEGSNLIWEDNPIDHVRGASKIYRRQCFENIGGLQRTLGWDTIDEVTARMKGWRTRSFPEYKIIHHRMIGSKDGAFSGCVRHGYIAYLTGQHPIYFILRCVYRFFDKPYFVGGVGLFWGYFHSWITRYPQVVGHDFIKYYRKESIKKLFNKNFWSLYKRGKVYKIKNHD